MLTAGVGADGPDAVVFTREYQTWNLKTIHDALRLIEDSWESDFEVSPFGGERELA